MRSINEKVPSICSEVSPETEGRDGRVEQEGDGGKAAKSSLPEESVRLHPEHA